MAQLVLGMAIPHSTLLGKAPETWLEEGMRDHRNPELWYRKEVYDYEQLKAARQAQGIERFLTLAERTRRFTACRDAIDVMRRVCRETEIDVAIVLGKDQREIFLDVTPTFAIHTEDKLRNGPPQRSFFAPDHPIEYPGAPDLATRLVTQLQAEGFDMAAISKLPPNLWLGNNPIVPHAFGFVYHEIMMDSPPPSIPVYLNTFYPPTQPTVGRCIEFGHALIRAVESWDEDLRIGLFASGGLSHFVVDEEFDRGVIEAFRNDDLYTLARIDERSYQSGTSEAKLFIPVMMAMSKRGPATLVDYVPCYRTEAGTGEGMCFMYWKP